MAGTLTRGDVVLVTLQGERGKPRPAVVMQSRALDDIPTVVILPCTSEQVSDCAYRPDVPAGEMTGLHAPTQAMADKIVYASLHRIKAVIGRAPAEVMDALTEATLFVVGAYD